ncbi:hypothetical protein JXA88_01070 [Candidatus Fermentibacteria bacterium]|nr:hypothetical protein [Candidatus Fermentibacteria bacterium]
MKDAPMPHGTSPAALARLIADILSLACVVASLAALGSYLVITVSRLGYPFDLEWMEGGMVDHVARIRAGQPLYVSPSPAFVPFTYPPLFCWTAAVVARVVGLGYPALRIVAFASSLACVALIGNIVRRETRSLYAAVVAMGLWAATYRTSGAWFDIARADCLFLALTLGSFSLVRCGASRRMDALAALLLVLASLTKQTAFAVAIVLICAVAVMDFRRGLFLGIVTVVGMSACHGTLHLATQGWYGYYVFDLPRRFTGRVLGPEILAFWTRDVLLNFGFAALLAVAWLVRTIVGRGGSGWIDLGMAAGMVAGAWLPRMQYGGYDNTLIPAYAILAVLAGLTVGVVRDRNEKRPSRRHLRMAVAVLCLGQFARLTYDPRAQIPTTRDRREGQWLLEMLASIEGEVLVPYHGFWPSRAGATGAHRMAVSDVLGCDPKGQGPILRAQFSDLRSSGRISAVVLDRDDWFFMDEVNRHYPRAMPAFRDSTTFRPRTGWPIRPMWIYLPGES